jgi:hypothetical protein
MAAGHGKIEEVDIDPIAKRTDEKWRRLPNGEVEQIATGKVRLGRDGKPRRPPKRRNSEDIRRDQLVEAMLSEAKRKMRSKLLMDISDLTSGLLRRTSTEQTSGIRFREQRRSLAGSIPGGLLRVCRGGATTAAQGRTSPNQGRKRSTERTKARWLQKRTGQDATGRRTSCKEQEVTFAKWILQVDLSRVYYYVFAG